MHWSPNSMTIFALQVLQNLHHGKHKLCIFVTSLSLTQYKCVTGQLPGLKAPVVSSYIESISNCTSKRCKGYDCSWPVFQLDHIFLQWGLFLQNTVPCTLLFYTNNEIKRKMERWNTVLTVQILDIYLQLTDLWVISIFLWRISKCSSWMKPCSPLHECIEEMSL